MKDFFQFILGLIVLMLIGFAVFYFLDIQAGSINDWLVGIICFFWLITITVIPWNAHFKAKEVLDDAEISKRKDIMVVDSSLDYVKKVAKLALILAISLHLISAAVLYYIASAGVSTVAYYAAAMALALTILRPTVRFYEYLSRRLSNIKQEFRYPREDLQTILEQLNRLEEDLDDQEGVPSWRNKVNAKFEHIQKKITDLQAQQAKRHQAQNEKIEALNQAIQDIRKTHQLQFDKITTDSNVLDAVRELGRFFKKL